MIAYGRVKAAVAYNICSCMTYIHIYVHAYSHICTHVYIYMYIYTKILPIAKAILLTSTVRKQ